jgi:formate hydrogenlyase transcriptional activator
MNRAKVTEMDQESLVTRLHDAEETLNAIRTGAVDAVVVNGDHGPQVFTLQSADHPYRVMVEVMNEGAFTVDRQGVILYANLKFAELMQRPVRDLVGRSILEFVDNAERTSLQDFLTRASAERMKRELVLRNGDGTPVPLILSLSPVPLDPAPVICAVATDLRDQRARKDAEAAEQRARELVAKLERSQFELREKVQDLETSHNVMVDRELKMIDLERQLKELKVEVERLKKSSRD